jgi:integrase
LSLQQCKSLKKQQLALGQIVRINWVDLDPQKNTLAINQPEKGGNSGLYKISDELMIHIFKLPKTNEKIFGKTSTDSMANTFYRVRKKLAFSFCNPRLQQIHFHTLRHWKLTAYAHEMKDPFMVQLFARHKDMKSTGK